jgi:hypothetical protein
MEYFNTRGQGQFFQIEVVDSLWFVNTTVSGLKMVASVDIRGKQFFFSE